MAALLQQTTPTPPAAPAPVPPSPDVVSTGQLSAGTLTRQQIEQLQARRSELSNQLESATRRRKDLAEQVSRGGPNRAGLEARLEALDGRILRLEGEIDQVGQQLASADAQRFTETRPPTNFEPGIHFSNVDSDLVVIFSALLLAPLMLSIARLTWRRGSRAYVAPSSSPDLSPRLERIEQAVDAIAIEVERVSEGQRFVTRLLSERPPELAPAAREPARVEIGEGGRGR
jgi:Spy/CpxP family protein refolding chaperone